MLTRKKSVRSRTKRARRKQDKFIAPDLSLIAGKLMRFVANEDSPLSEAERLRGKYAEMEDGNDAEVRQFLQRAYFVALQFRRRPREFERLQVHPFWKQLGQKPPDPSTSKWVLLFIMQATMTDVPKRAGEFAVILDGLMQDQVEVSAVAARIQELGGVRAAYEAMRVGECGAAQVSGTVAVTETAAAGLQTCRPDERSPRKIGESATPTKRTRRRRPQPTFPHPSFPNLFAGYSSNPDPFGGDSSLPDLFPDIEFKRNELLGTEEFEEGVWVAERVPTEDAFDFVQRLTKEYAKIKDGDHKSVRRVLQRAYLAALKMQREPDEFERLKADSFWKASWHKPNNASTSKWVVYFIMQARTSTVCLLARKYTTILDRLLRDEVRPDDLRIAQMEGVDAAYEAVRSRQRIRGLKPWSRR